MADETNPPTTDEAADSTNATGAESTSTKPASTESTGAESTNSEATSGDAASSAAGPGTGMNSALPGVPDREPHTPEQEAMAADVEECMYEVIDPELGINVIDLGLVYDIGIEGTNDAVIYMTLTSPACPLTEFLEDQTYDAVVKNGPAARVRIDWVWSPPWNQTMITEDGRDQLIALGGYGMGSAF